jgi:phage tail sheath protein FI
MPTYYTPGVYFETVDTGRRGITAIRTDIVAFVGIAERGPLHQPTPVNSWEQFQATFGGFIPNGYLAYAAKAFFENGGQRCYVVRVAADPASTEADPAVTQPADRATSVVLSTAGFAPGAVVTVRQAPSLRRNYLLQQVDETNRKLVWENPLATEFVLNDLSKPLYFDTGAAAAHGTLLDGDGKPTLRVEASTPGAWGNRLHIQVVRSNPAATRTTSAVQPIGGPASLVGSVVGFSVGSLVRVFQEQTVGPPLVTTRIVEAVAADTGRIAWDTPLDAGYDLNKPISFETLEFALSVYEAGRMREVLSGLSLVPEHDRYVERAITGETSHLIRVEDLGSPSLFPARLPDPGAANLTQGRLRLEEGRDGIAALQVEDFTGDPGSERRWGLCTLEKVEEVAIVAMPDAMIQPVHVAEKAPRLKPEAEPCLPGEKSPPMADPLPPPLIERAPTFTLDQVSIMQQALVAHCEARCDRIALLDPPIFSRDGERVDVGEIQSWRQRFDSKYAALYHPWVLVYDPLQLGGQVVRPIPPSGHVAGVIARTDVSVGVHMAPANVEILWAQDATTEVTPEIQGLLNPRGINCIRSFPGRGLRVYGARTVSSDPLWRYLSVRRLLLMIEEALDISTQWAVFEPNDYYLRQTLTLAISSFLQALWEQGALAGETAEDAFFVRCDEENNPSYVTDLGQLVAEVGVAPVYPAEFVVLRIGRTEDELEITEMDGSTTWL